jgi:uncharacterized membrane protein
VTAFNGINLALKCADYQTSGGIAMAGRSAYIYDAGLYTLVDFPGALGSVAVRIGDDDRVLGGWLGDDQRIRGFLQQDGVFTTLEFPGALDTLPFDFNASGQIVGVYFDPAFLAHGFLLDGGLWHSFDYPGEQFTYPHGINDQGQIVGSYGPGWDGSRGFIAQIRRCLGPADSNCDGAVNSFDIDPFVQALTSPTAWESEYSCDFLCANDVDCDGAVNVFDIDPFVQCLIAGGCPPCP